MLANCLAESFPFQTQKEVKKTNGKVFPWLLPSIHVTIPALYWLKSFRCGYVKPLPFCRKDAPFTALNLSGFETGLKSDTTGSP